MKFKMRFADQIVGAFVFLAILALAGILILMGFNQRWFAKDYHYTSRFQTASGLNTGMAIRLKGFQIGAVDSISLLEDNTVNIQFHIYDTYWEKVRPHSVLDLVTSPIGIGGGGLILYPGKNRGEPLPDGSYIPSLDFKEGLQLVEDGLVEMSEKGDKITGIIDSVGPLLEKVDQAVLSINGLVDEVRGSLSGTGSGVTADIMRDVRTMTGELNVMLANTSENLEVVLTDTQATIGNFKSLTEEPEGLITTLLNPQGSIRKILDDDDELYNSLNNALTEVNKTLANLQEITVYLSNTTPQIAGLLEESRDTLDKGKEVLEGVSNNPLIRGGIPEVKEQPATFQSYRDEEF
ncbi:MAG: MCE family protein [Spirochaetales bacterium]|nr:MCE family protein [Spirochaetales bacterium]